MRLHHSWRTASILALAVALTACGGGSTGGGGIGVISTPPPPTPPPPPPPSPPPPVGLTQQADFATLSVNSSYTVEADGRHTNLVSDLTGATEFHYLAAEQAYEVVLPGLAAGRVETTGGFDAYSNNNVRLGNTPGTQQAHLFLFRPGPGNPVLPLTYTSFGIWGSGPPDTRGPSTGGIFAYGVPTVASDVPRSGTGLYRAEVAAVALDSGAGLGGHADLVFHFGTGALTGSMTIVSDPWGYGADDSFLYHFTQTAFAVGSNTFSGRFLIPETTEDSFFEGQFTGPQAAELMARFSAPYFNHYSQQWARLQGVWAGKRNK